MPSASQLPRNPSGGHLPDMSRDIRGLQRAVKSVNFIILEGNEIMARNSPTVISRPAECRRPVLFRSHRRRGRAQNWRGRRVALVSLALLLLPARSADRKE